MQKELKISSGIILPLKFLGSAVMTFCIFIGIRYLVKGISLKDYMMAGAGTISLAFPAFFTHHIYGLKFLWIDKSELVVRDLFNTYRISISSVIGISRTNNWAYEIETSNGKRISTVLFFLNTEQYQRIKQLLGNPQEIHKGH